MKMMFRGESARAAWLFVTLVINVRIGNDEPSPRAATPPAPAQSGSPAPAPAPAGAAGRSSG